MSDDVTPRSLQPEKTLRRFDINRKGPVSQQPGVLEAFGPNKTKKNTDLFRSSSDLCLHSLRQGGYLVAKDQITFSNSIGVIEAVACSSEFQTCTSIWQRDGRGGIPWPGVQFSKPWALTCPGSFEPGKHSSPCLRHDASLFQLPSEMPPFSS